jgi:hypothetical protein
LYVKIEQAYDVRVNEPLRRLRLLLKLLLIHVAQIQYLNGSLFGRKSYMLTQIDTREPTHAYASYQTIVAKLLTSEILSEGHSLPPYRPQNGKLLPCPLTL